VAQGAQGGHANALLLTSTDGLTLSLPVRRDRLCPHDASTETSDRPALPGRRMHRGRHWRRRQRFSGAQTCGCRDCRGGRLRGRDGRCARAKTVNPEVAADVELVPPQLPISSFSTTSRPSLPASSPAAAATRTSKPPADICCPPAPSANLCRSSSTSFSASLKRSPTSK
jgi:hypothetical protein